MASFIKRCHSSLVVWLESSAPLLTPFSSLPSTPSVTPPPPPSSSVRAEGGGRDEGHRPGVQQRSHPVQQLRKLWRGRHRAAGLPDRHRSDTVTPQRLWTAPTVMWSSPRAFDWHEINDSVQESVARPSSRTCGSHQRNPCTWRARWSMSPSGTPSSSSGHPCKTTANRPTISILPGCIYLSKLLPDQVTTVMRSGAGSSPWYQVQGEDRSAATVLYSLQTCNCKWW